jgi:hypothetical protein
LADPSAVAYWTGIATFPLRVTVIVAEVWGSERLPDTKFGGVLSY